MKSIVVISAMTFVLIFAVIVLLSGMLPRAAVPPAPAAEKPTDVAAAEREFKDLAVERDRARRDQERALAASLALAVEEKVLDEQRQKLQGLVDSLRIEHTSFSAERVKAVTRLAKVYEAMKPEKAAPILATLEMDVVLDIMSRMKERPAARILASMDAGLAAQISARLSNKAVG
jgi:flagellar motility protein MotE (MotC chaperone)